jgi:ribonuclease G
VLNYLAGRFIVLVPFSDRVSISKKIEDKKGKRQTKKTTIKPKGLVLLFAQ